MTALNMQRQVLGHSMAYDDGDFIALIEQYHIHHNGVLSEFTN